MNTKIFCDIAELDKIKKFNKKKIVKGFTTNPSLMRKAGAKDYKLYSKKILEICKNKPVSFEVFADEYKEMKIQTRLNGEIMQNAKLSQLIFDIPILISYVSKAMAWRAGDVLVTGTPGGVGFKRNPPVFMKPGDKVEVEVTQIGVLSNTIKDEII